MKVPNGVFVALAAIGLSLAGCSKQSGPSVDTAPLQQNFKSAAPFARSSANKAAAAAKAGDYPSAIAQLQALAGNAKLTPAQQAAVKDVMAQAQKALAAVAVKANAEAAKAVSDMKKNLPK